jgi:hypothetical protein
MLVNRENRNNDLKPDTDHFNKSEPAPKILRTDWYPAKKLIVTQISGEVDAEDITLWKDSFKSSLDRIENGGTFKIFVNLFGFKAININVHKLFRDIIPLTLADYGWEVGYVRMFEEEASKIKYTRKRNIRCVGAAHAHHDETKMEIYQSCFSRSEEHFFKDPKEAEMWIENLHSKEDTAA